MARLLNLALAFVATAPPDENVATPLRLIEIFTSSSSTVQLKMFQYLVSKDYFGNVRRLCDARIPPLMSETSRPPTPLSATILAMVTRPLDLLDDEPTLTDFAKEALLNLTQRFFVTPFTEQVDFFVIPALAENVKFPYGKWNKVLDGYSEGGLEFTPWLLYSFLKIGKNHLGEERSRHFDVQQYLSVLSNLTGTILTKLNSGAGGGASHPEDSDDSDDEDVGDQGEAMDVDQGGRTSLMSTNSAISRSLAMLNDVTVVNSLVAATERSPEEPLALAALCKLCHHLLLADSLALHHFRLLYTLAFRTTLLHRLWNLILDTRRPSLLGSSVPLLTVIARGIRLSSSERDAIVPLLAVFTSLFCYLLVTIHDTEFYGEESMPTSSTATTTATSTSTGATSGSTSRNWMPFTLAELVTMSLSLRDVTLGLIELAFPQSRPVVREEYQQAVK